MDAMLSLETPTFEFPKGVLCHILSFADTQQRLNSCSTVSHAWHEAAASATRSITASSLHDLRDSCPSTDDRDHLQHQADKPIKVDRPGSLTLWLNRHGSNLTQLTVIKDSSSDWGWRPWFSVRRRLEWPVPWQQLSQLRSLGVQCILDSSSSSDGTSSCCGSLAVLCKLTSLTLRCCSFSSSLHSLRLASLTQLRHLELYSVVAGEGEDLQPGPACAAVVAAAEARLANQQEDAPPAELAAAAGAEEEHAAAAPAAAAPAAAEQEEILVDEEEQQIEAQEWWEPEDEEAEISKAAVHFPPAQFLQCGLGSCLGDLVQLTHLYLGCQRLSAADLAGISCLQQLRELEFCMCGGLQRAAGALVELPASLTSLKIIYHVNLQWLEFTDACMPGIFNSLSNLQHLELFDALSLDPHVLTRLPALTCLRMEQYNIKGFFEFDPPGEAGEMALMHVLPQLSQLQQLQLSCVLYGGVQEPLQLYNYSALFSASRLTAVNLLECEFDPGFGRAVFAPELQLPQLLRLQMGWGVGDDIDRLTNSATNHFYDKEEWPLGPGDIDRLVRCCPNLQQLWLTTVVAPGTPMGALTALTALTELAVGGDVVDDAVAVGVLAQLTQLQGLAVVFSETLSVSAWQHLEEVLPCGAVLGQCQALFESQGDEQHEQHAAD